ncbi:MAG: glycerol-3-phosphate 1-O-acyltransferase PlsY [Candidatus Omnitrophota bacterium]
MLLIVKTIAGLILAYLLGSIPTAYIAGKLLKGIDIRQHGSKNVGATNVFRVLGKTPGIIVLGVDILKGVLAVVVIPLIFGFHQVVTFIILGLAAVCGHNWTIFLKFKGGKGVATSLGVLIGLTINVASMRLIVSLCVLIWLGVFIGFGYVSLASIVSVLFLPLLMVVSFQSIELIILGVIFCLLVVWRHRPNIQRLLQGRESRFRFPFRKA